MSDYRDEWLSHDETIRMKKKLQEDLQGMLNGWMNGYFTTESIEGTAQKNAEALGKVQAIQDMLDYLENR